MGEHKRREAERKAHDAIIEKLVETRKLIDGGFSIYRRIVIPADAGPVQIDETRRAFFAGAQHLFASIMAMLDPAVEPTDKDMDRMDAINKEFQEWADLENKRLSALKNPGSVN